MGVGGGHLVRWAVTLTRRRRRHDTDGDGRVESCDCEPAMCCRCEMQMSRCANAMRDNEMQIQRRTGTCFSLGQSDSCKRKLALSDDEGDDAGKSSNKEVTGKQPRQTNTKKKTSSRPMPKIRKSSRKPSDIDPSGKDSEPTDMETGPSKKTGPAAEDRPSDEQPATDNIEASNEPPTRNQSAEARVGANQESPIGNQSGTEPNRDIPEVEAQTNSPSRKDASADPGSSSPVKVQEPARPRPEIITGPMIGDEEEILRIQSAEDSRPPILVKWWDDDMQPQGIVINKQKEDEEVCLLKKALGQATHGTSEEAALDLINDAQKAANKIAIDVVERFQDNDLRPTGSDNSDDEKTDTD
ncbi:uncharacterized protein LOC127770208 [Oryza glaberrima]|uniref:uncharacterized protein LOC127770208 n=1 Tax=Oryza glaberrima TaxID=4538 RepID=UPI00224C1CB8|nr:uncharacterized protein LOC127770208 [Oryza glaberrima]